MSPALTTDEVIGQAFVFFLGGYETTAGTLQFIGYVLATQSGVQDKLAKEISLVLGEVRFQPIFNSCL